jgi:ferredoxin
MATSVSIDPELCIGSGECGRLVPAAFKLDEHLGVSVPLEGARDAPLDLLARAARTCPGSAITVISGGLVVVASASMDHKAGDR